MTESNPNQSPQELSKESADTSSGSKPEFSAFHGCFIFFVLMIGGGFGGLVVTVYVVDFFWGWWVPEEYLLFGIIVGAISGACLGMWMLRAKPTEGYRMTESNPNQSPQEFSKEAADAPSGSKPEFTAFHGCFIFFVLLVAGGFVGLIGTITLVNFWGGWISEEFVLQGIAIGAISGACLGVWMLRAKPTEGYRMSESNPYQSPQELSKESADTSSGSEPEFTAFHGCFIFFVLLVAGGFVGLIGTITLVNLLGGWWVPEEFVLLGIAIGAGSGVFLAAWILLVVSPPNDKPSS